jgi:hypothetical protein
MMFERDTFGKFMDLSRCTFSVKNLKRDAMFGLINDLSRLSHYFPGPVGVSGLFVWAQPLRVGPVRAPGPTAQALKASIGDLVKNNPDDVISAQVLLVLKGLAQT